ncbi:8776_t:CDS:2, partial [Scutellospora calospora]
NLFTSSEYKDNILAIKPLNVNNLQMLKLKKVSETPAQKIYRYTQSGDHLIQKYFGYSQQMQHATQIIIHKDDVQSGVPLPLTNFVNAQ